MAAADGSGHGARAGWLRRRVFGPRLAAVLADDWWLPELGASLDSSNFIVPSKVGWIHHECLGASSNSRVVWCHSFLFLFNARLPPVPKPNPGRASDGPSDERDYWG